MEDTSICLFYGQRDPKTGFLSNFYPVSFPYVLPQSVAIHAGERVQVDHSEQAIMLTKAALFGDEVSFTALLQRGQSPAACKKLGRNVTSFVGRTWMKNVSEFAVHVLYHKFGMNSDLCKRLLETAPATLAEAAPYDRIWGIGLCATHPDAHTPQKWRGENILGRALMTVRTMVAATPSLHAQPTIPIL